MTSPPRKGERSENGIRWGAVAHILRHADGTPRGAEITDNSGNRYFASGDAVRRFRLEPRVGVAFNVRNGSPLLYAEIHSADTRAQLTSLLPIPWRGLLSQPKPDPEVKPTRELDLLLEEASLALVSDKTSWVAEALGDHELKANPKLMWLLDRAVALAYARSGDQELLPRHATHTGDGSLTSYLVRYPHARSALRVLYQLAGRLAYPVRHDRGAETFYGWINLDLADNRHPLPPGHHWADVLGNEPTRWKVWLGTQAAAPNRRTDFAQFDAQLVVVNRGNLTERFGEAHLRAMDNDRGLRAITFTYDAGQEAQFPRFTDHLCDSLRRNVDIFTRRAVYGSAFFGREEELAEIEDHLAGGYGVAVVGARRSGKSTLARQFAFRLDGIRPPLLSFDTTSWRENELVPEIARVLSLTSKPTTFAQLLSALRLGSATQNRRTIVIDEFGSAFETSPGTQRAADALALARFIRTAVEEEALRILVCNPRSNIYTDPYLHFGDQSFDNPLLDRIRRVHLSGLDIEAAEKLLDHFSRRTLCKLPTELRTQIVEQTGAFPVLLRAALHSATHDCERPMTISEDAMARAFAENTADTSPWSCANSFFLRWALGWARSHLEALRDGRPLPADSKTHELTASGIIAGSKNAFAFPLLERVARATLSIGVNHD